MANESVVYERKKLAGPRTHALIIGVGWYPHLPGGGGKQLEQNEGLGQLSSPPVSARVMADWMIDRFDNPDRPLGSVRLLTSEKGKAKTFTNPRTQQEYSPQLATLQAIDQAVDEWFAAGNTDPENMLLFYFCGHGIGTQLLLSLLAHDFGVDPENALEAAIDFQRFRLGMNRCAAKYQVFFVDACRSFADTTVYAEGFAGQPLKAPSGSAVAKQQPIYYSTLLGANAFGEKNRPSYFAQALLDAFRGTGADRASGDWRVNTNRLQEALATQMTRRMRPQLASVDNLSQRFDIHHLKDTPKIPVIVSCIPPELSTKVKLACRLKGKLVHERVKPNKKPWEIELAALVNQVYVFTASGGGKKTPLEGTERWTISPPEQLVPLRVRAKQP